MTQRVFVDANVLASKTLRDWLFLLRNETDGMFQLHTTFDVLVETVRVFRRRHPDAYGRRSRELFDLLSRSVDEVLSDFVGSVDFAGIDRGDLHVHAAALGCHADVLLTQNVRDFGDVVTHTYDVFPPDEFFVLIDDSAPHSVRQVTREQVAYWQSRRDAGAKVKPLSRALVDTHCHVFAGRVNDHVRALANG